MSQEKAKPEAKPKEVKKIAPNRFALAEFKRAIHYATVEPGTTIEQLEDPTYWSLVATSVKPYDHIEVVSDDGTLWANFLVLACDRTWLHIRLLQKVALETSDVSISRIKPTAAMRESYEIKHMPSSQWTVIRVSDPDKPVVSKDHQTRELAESWVREHIKTVAVT